MSTNLLERVSAGRAWDPKLACTVTLALVFLCGAAAGALVMDLGVHNKLRPPAFDTVAGKAIGFERIQRELKLTPAQSEQMQSVLNDFWQYYRTVLSDGKARVEQLLTPEQRQRFESILQERQRR